MKNQNYRSLLISSASRRTSKWFNIFNSWPNILLNILILQLICWSGSQNWSKQMIHKSNWSSFKVQHNGLLSKSQAAIATRLSINNIKKKILHTAIIWLLKPQNTAHTYNMDHFSDAFVSFIWNLWSLFTVNT